MRFMRGTAMPDGHAVCAGTITWLEHKACPVIVVWSFALRLIGIFSIRRCDLELFFAFVLHKPMPRMGRSVFSVKQYLSRRNTEDEKMAKSMMGLADEGILDLRMAMRILAGLVEVYEINPWEHSESRMGEKIMLKETGEVRI
ncbi:MAG: hypothetical protein HGB08_03950 [Candidatus Moranbacteria bacterium]|nr:hypothetical protein [Candidatus Moranbacteria bacterium]